MLPILGEQSQTKTYSALGAYAPRHFQESGNRMPDASDAGDPQSPNGEALPSLLGGCACGIIPHDSPPETIPMAKETNGKNKGKGSTAIAAAMAKAKGPQKPDYVPQDAWAEMDADQMAFASDPANADAVKAAYSGGDGGGEPSPKEEGERAEMAVSEGYLPTSFDNVTSDLASKVSEQDRERVVAVVEKEMSVKVETVALVCVIERAFGKGAVALPRYGSTAADSNNPDVFEYKKKTSKGTFAKKPVEGSVLEITAYKAMISLGLHNEIRDIEKKVAALGKGAQVPFAWVTQLSKLREKRNKLVKKFIFAIRLVHALSDIGDMSKVGWNWIATDGTTDIADDMSNLTEATECVLLYAKGKDGSRGMSVALSPNVIIGYRVAVANNMPEGGTLDNLLASAEAPTPEQPEGEAELEIPNFVEANRVLRALDKWLEKFIGPSANKVDAKAFDGYLLSDAGSEMLARIFRMTTWIEEAVTSRDNMRSKETTNRHRIEAALGGTASRQVKDQSDGTKAVA